MTKPIKKIERQSLLLGQNGTKYDKLDDFKGSWTKVNSFILGDYGRNIYDHGKRIGYALDVRFPGYRGLPVNLIRSLVFEVDGVVIPDECRYIRYEEREYAFNCIGTDKIENTWYWKFGDYLRVFFKIDGGIQQGIHFVKFGLAMHDHYNTTAYCEKNVTIV